MPPKIKTLSAEDAHRYSIFDVIMPLPGRDVAYPGGSLGERYREFLRKDGLDPDDFLRKQKQVIHTSIAASLTAWVKRLYPQWIISQNPPAPQQLVMVNTSIHGS